MEVSLLIEDQVFTVKRDSLCEHSDYFRAMFSGSYVENEKTEIRIDVVDANSMNIILQYMDLGFVELSEYNLSTIAELSAAANFLQIPELTKQIEYSLDLRLTHDNWVETMSIAETAAFPKLEQLSAAFGLYSFESMLPEHIPSLEKLYWYLSHPYLNSLNELEVFRFGLNWISKLEFGGDVVLLILCCLDLKRLTKTELEGMKSLVVPYENSLVSKVIDCLYHLSSLGHELEGAAISSQKTTLCETFTERVYTEVMNLVKESRARKLTFVPSVPMWIVKGTKPEVVPHFMYTFKKETGFEQWIEVSDKNLWGWHVVEWGPTKLVVVGGEHGRGTGIFSRDVKVYDTLRQEWIQHGVELPPRRHGGVAVINDSLYILGGVGGFRVVLDAALIYDLKQRTFRSISKLPDPIQNPAVCKHKKELYTVGHKSIIKYDISKDRWVEILPTDFRTSYMVSFNDYIYCTQNYFNHLYRFVPGEGAPMEMVTYFTNPPAAISHLGERFLVFTRPMCGQTNRIAVEEYTGDADAENNRPEVIWSQTDSILRINDVSGCCTVIMTVPPVHTDESQYHKRYLKSLSSYISKIY